MTKRKMAIGIVAALVSLLIALPIVTGCGGPPAAAEIEMYSAKFGGVMYLNGAGLTELVNNNSTWLRMTQLETGGSIDNIKMNVDDPEKRAKALRGGTASTFWLAIRGQAPLFDRKYDLKVILSFAVTPGMFATSDPNIKGPQDLVGKKVGVGEQGSAFLAETQFLLRDCWGIWD